MTRYGWMSWAFSELQSRKTPIITRFFKRKKRGMSQSVLHTVATPRHYRSWKERSSVWLCLWMSLRRHSTHRLFGRAWIPHTFGIREISSSSSCPCKVTRLKQHTGGVRSTLSSQHDHSAYWITSSLSGSPTPCDVTDSILSSTDVADWVTRFHSWLARHTGIARTNPLDRSFMANVDRSPTTTTH